MANDSPDAESSPPSQSSNPPAPTPPPQASELSAPVAKQRRSFGRLRVKIPFWQSLLLGALCIVVAFAVWWFLTAGKVGEVGNEPIVSPLKLPSVVETLREFKSLWFERELTRNTYASLKRVVFGFGLAAIIGVPVGILCGCFTRIAAFLAPLTIFGRNIPMAALIPLSFLLFGIDELQKIMFIFIAAVAFIITDAAQAIRDVQQRYIDTAYTLGANRRQAIVNVIVPLAMPSIFNSLRLLFGLAFGYIMLAEVIQTGDAQGLGGIIANSQRRGPREHIYLVLMIIPIVALTIDRLLYWIQIQLFPYRYAGPGLLAKAVRWLLHGWERMKHLVITPLDIDVVTGAPVIATAEAEIPQAHEGTAAPDAVVEQSPAAEKAHSETKEPESVEVPRSPKAPPAPESAKPEAENETSP